ncbi:MAG: MgtC/SapB family protein [Nitratiruptor sp.]|nr:MgtC/SapB family protein [Nitratiruptor sp.]NPA83408.1 MgtC/SapB family protein [Campylobacterota bacterium]
MEVATIQKVALALLLGFMIGLQRSIATQGTTPLGSRTFALIALVGLLAAWLEERIEGLYLVVAGSVGGLLVVSYWMKGNRLARLGLTTPMAALATFLVGGLVWFDLGSYAIAIAVSITLLLELKPRIQRLRRYLAPQDMEAITLLLVMSYVILPLLPDRLIGPYHLFNPYKTWLMAILIATISFVGYMAMKLFGDRYGIFVTGAAGGLVSSTAVTIGLSRLYLTRGGSVAAYAGGIAIASTFMYLRVFIESAIINPALARQLAIPYLLASILGLGYSFWLYRQAATTRVTVGGLETNPLQLKEAIKFALLFGLIYGAVEFVRHRYGAMGIYAISFLSGLSDVDAITLSLAQMAKEGLSSWTAISGIVIASATNSLVKLALTFWIGGGRLGWEVGKFFLITLAGMFLGLWWLRGG